MARTYLLGRSPELVTRTLADVINDIKKSYHGATAKRWERFARSEPLKSLVRIPLVETEAGHLLAVLRHPRAGTSTNVWLRRLHNYAMDVGWLLSPALPRKAWPRIVHQTRAGITAEEHARIIAQELILTPYDLRHAGIVFYLQALIEKRLKTGNFGHAMADLSIQVGHGSIEITLATYVGTAAFILM